MSIQPSDHQDTDANVPIPRSSSRVPPAAGTVNVVLETASGVIGAGTVLNEGVDGIAIMLRSASIEPGQEVQIRLPTRNRPARVLHVRAQGVSFRIGLEWLDRRTEPQQPDTLPERPMTYRD